MSNKAAACDAVGEVYSEPASDENKGAAVALPEAHYNGYSDGSEPLYTAEQMGDYAAAFRAEGEADLRARLAAAEAEVVRLRAQRDEAVAALKWMAQRGAHVAWSLDCEVCNVWLPAERDETPARPAEGYPQKCYATWEEAITAASGLSLASLKEQAA